MKLVFGKLNWQLLRNDQFRYAALLSLGSHLFLIWLMVDLMSASTPPEYQGQNLP